MFGRGAQTRDIVSILYQIQCIDVKYLFLVYYIGLYH